MSRTKKKPLNIIPTGVFTRGIALAKVSISLGSRAAVHTVGTLFSDPKQRADGLNELMNSQIKVLVEQLGQLKGSLMKVGQMLSMYGEHFLPPEANNLLKSLQSEAPPLAWSEIQKVLKRQLGEEKLALLEIDESPFASASLGQVHLARRRSDGRKIALKVQYPGVDRAIESDLKAMRSILTLASLLPKGGDTDEIFKEIRSMLHQEVDYSKELLTTQEFRQAFADLPGVVIPEVFEEFSSHRALATSFENGVAVDGPEVAALPAERRNAIAALALEVYFRELLVLGKVQTDPHFGNYRVRIAQGAEGGDSPGRDFLVLLDFGAVRKFSESFIQQYRDLVRGAYLRDRVLLEKAGLRLGFLHEGDSAALRLHFIELCEMMTEPFAVEEYDWGQSDLPHRVVKKAGQIVLGFRLRVPPREIIFLDRKMSGLFVFLSVLRAKIPARAILEQYLAPKR